MWYKKFCRVWGSLIIFTVCFYFGVMVCVSHLVFMDDEVADYLENKEYAQCTTNNTKVLIMGDSTAKAGFQPKILGESVYNYALGGSSPIDDYFYLREYIEKNAKPKTLILGFLQEHLRHGGCFWSRSVYFHRISFSDLLELSLDVNKFAETAYVGKENFKQKCWSYYLYSWEKYGQAFKALLSGKWLNRYKYNKNHYRLLKANSGHRYYGRAKESHGLNGETKLNYFASSELIEYYFDKIVALCKDNNIKVIVCSMPINRTSYKALKNEYKRTYVEFLKKLSCKYKTAIVETEIVVLDDRCFGDATHLNKEGSPLYSRKIKEKYKNYLY